MLAETLTPLEAVRALRTLRDSLSHWRTVLSEAAVDCDEDDLIDEDGLSDESDSETMPSVKQAVAEYISSGNVVPVMMSLTNDHCFVELCTPAANGSTPLHALVHADASDMLKYILQHCAPSVGSHLGLDREDRYRRTPLAIALSNRSFSTTELLLRYGARPDHNSVMKAVQSRSPALLREVAEGRFYINMNMDLVVEAARCGMLAQLSSVRPAIMAVFLQHDAHSLLDIVIREGNLVDTDFILRSVNIDRRELQPHLTKVTTPSIFLSLMRRKVDVNHVDATGNTPLHTAARQNNGMLVRLLLCRKARPGRPNSFGFCPIHYTRNFRDSRHVAFSLVEASRVDEQLIPWKRNVKLWCLAQLRETTLRMPTDTVVCVTRFLARLPTNLTAKNRFGVTPCAASDRYETHVHPTTRDWIVALDRDVYKPFCNSGRPLNVVFETKGKRQERIEREKAREEEEAP
jgi:ankyrin repeat protein